MPHPTDRSNFTLVQGTRQRHHQTKSLASLTRVFGAVAATGAQMASTGGAGVVLPPEGVARAYSALDREMQEFITEVLYRFAMPSADHGTTIRPAAAPLSLVSDRSERDGAQ
jgi:hypothetical protein